MVGLVSRAMIMLAEHGKSGNRLSNIRRKPSSCGSISTDMVVMSSTEADGESADCGRVAVQRSKRVWVVDGGRLINGRRLGDEVRYGWIEQKGSKPDSGE